MTFSVKLDTVHENSLSTKAVIFFQFDFIHAEFLTSSSGKQHYLLTS